MKIKWKLSTNTRCEMENTNKRLWILWNFLENFKFSSFVVKCKVIWICAFEIWKFDGNFYLLNEVFRLFVLLKDSWGKFNFPGKYWKVFSLSSWSWLSEVTAKTSELHAKSFHVAEIINRLLPLRSVGGWENAARRGVSSSHSPVISISSFVSDCPFEEPSPPKW